MHAKVKTESSTKTSKGIKRLGKVETRHVYRPMRQDEITKVRLLRVLGALRGEISWEVFVFVFVIVNMSSKGTVEPYSPPHFVCCLVMM